MICGMYVIYIISVIFEISMSFPISMISDRFVMFVISVISVFLMVYVIVVISVFFVISYGLGHYPRTYDECSLTCSRNPHEKYHRSKNKHHFEVLNPY